MDVQTKIDIIRCYYSSGSSLTCALRMYKGERGLKHNPFTLTTMRRVIERFQETGSVCDRPRSGRPSLLTEREGVVQEALKTTATAIGTSSTRRISSATNIPQSSVNRILKRQLKLYPYHLRRSHALLPADTQARLDFAAWFQNQSDDFINNIIWSDECYFSLGGHVNSHNAVVWGTEKPKEPLTKGMFPQKVLVWMGVSSKCVIKPFFFDGTATADKYLSMLQHHLVPELRHHRLLRSAVFMQDGAPPHIGKQVKKFLVTRFSPTKVISRNFDIPWPARSPDLNPCDFWLWGALKDAVYQTTPTTMDELKMRIVEAANNITPAQVALAVNNLLARMHLLIDNDGGLIEHLL